MLARKPLGARYERRGAQGDGASGAVDCEGLSGAVAAYPLASRAAIALPELDASGALVVPLSLHAKVADDVPTHGFPPVLGDLCQPGGAVLRAGAAFDLGIPGAQPNSRVRRAAGVRSGAVNPK